MGTPSGENCPGQEGIQSHNQVGQTSVPSESVGLTTRGCGKIKVVRASLLASRLGDVGRNFLVVRACGPQGSVEVRTL